jgi:legumain
LLKLLLCGTRYINCSFFFQYERLDHQTEKKKEILEKIAETVKHRKHLDGSVELIGVLLFGPTKGSSILQSVREPGLPLVDDWQCLKSKVNINN